jgi:PPP family 3-phenylpropionic acid transporter
MSAAYFLYFVGFGLYVPYFPAYLRGRGLDAAAVGWFVALAPLMRIFVPPLVGLVADRRGGPRRWSAVCAWGGAGGLALVAAGPGAAALLAGTFLFSAFTAPTIPLLDSAAVRAGARGFGAIRLWGSLGYLLTSFGLGYFFPSLPGAAVVAGLLGAQALFALYVSLPAGGDEEAPAPRLSWGEVRLLARDARIGLLLSTLFLNRVASAPFNGFYTLFVQDSGLSGRVVALTWGVAITTEVAAMLFVDRALGRFGTAAVLAAGVGLEAARWLAYGFVRGEGALLALAPLHGLAFCLLYVAGVRCVAEVVPPGLRSLGQGVSATAAGLGQAAGIVAAGYLYEGAGPRATFAAAGLVGGLAVASALLLGRASAGRALSLPRGR